MGKSVGGQPGCHDFGGRDEIRSLVAHIHHTEPAVVNFGCPHRVAMGIEVVDVSFVINSDHHRIPGISVYIHNNGSSAAVVSPDDIGISFFVNENIVGAAEAYIAAAGPSLESNRVGQLLQVDDQKATRTFIADIGIMVPHFDVAPDAAGTSYISHLFGLCRIAEVEDIGAFRASDQGIFRAVRGGISPDIIQVFAKGNMTDEFDIFGILRIHCN